MTGRTVEHDAIRDDAGLLRQFGRIVHRSVHYRQRSTRRSSPSRTPRGAGILERLGRGPATLSQLAGPSGLTLNGIKKHVGILEFAGLVETEKVGRARECRLGPATTLGEAGEWIEAHRRAWEGRLDRFERFVERRGVSRELRYERLIQASPARVFDLFTSPAGQREFYGNDAPGWVVESRCELRVGGVWEIAFGPSPGELYRHRHVFEAIDRPAGCCWPRPRPGSTGRARTSHSSSRSSPATGRR